MVGKLAKVAMLSLAAMGAVIAPPGGPAMSFMHEAQKVAPAPKATKPSPQRAVRGEISLAGLNEKQKWDRLRGTKFESRSKHQNRSPGDRAHKRWKRQRRAA